MNFESEFLIFLIKLIQRKITTHNSTIKNHKLKNKQEDAGFVIGESGIVISQTEKPDFSQGMKVNDLKIAEQLIIEHLGLIKTKWNEVHGF